MPAKELESLHSRREYDMALPKPNINSSYDEEEVAIRGMFCNPIYAGVGPYPAIVDDVTWVRAAARAIEEDGVEQWLVNMLNSLRGSIGEVSEGLPN